jgi:hypothetical protein
LAKIVTEGFYDSIKGGGKLLPFLFPGSGSSFMLTNFIVILFAALNH